ncbi:hypothetical protein GH714_009493 [Hevea brasiliensis]|uniref:Integrase catalytic domain-containing protein n=1 Tax=Hevea brasiliensis TaxID=3981 RepID=A0A6A6L2H7_HEVBR|nr:hypothetical protein GH714_009493 [Hevea brasiliensis]
MAKNFELEAVLSRRESMTENTLAGNKNNKEGPNMGKAATDNLQNPNIVKCYRCGKIGHIRKLFWKVCFIWAERCKVLDNVKTISADVVTSGERKGSLFFISAGEAYVRRQAKLKMQKFGTLVGHLGYQLLQQISSKTLVDGIPALQNIHEDVICQGCQFGKSHRLLFTKSSNHRSSMLELVHTNLMGPTKTPSYSGYRYVMVLVDDFSRYTWVKFLKQKSEALSKFAEFRDAVEKEFGKKIKCLRSDNGGEYMSVISFSTTATMVFYVK